MLTGISLFSSSGIGDIPLRDLGIDIIVANELLPDRCSMYKKNFPETRMFEGDIWKLKSKIISETQELLQGRKLDFALVTPPCQGMSKNGRGKLLSEINAGRRPKEDERNLLIIPALEIIKKLKPSLIIFENVPEMVNTCITFNNKILQIIDLIQSELEEWLVYPEVIEFADYGIPQRRQRLITIATKNILHKKYFQNFGSILPPTTHSKKKINGRKKWVTVRDIICGMEPLDGSSKIKSSKDPLHRVSKLDDKKYWWVSSTPESSSAFDNQCVKCGFSKNSLHKSFKNSEGINRSSSKTPIFCKKCNGLLPRPTVEKNGEVKLMTGFTSAYKRMDWDLPSSAITRNFPYACSDNKLHPEQNRTLSIREACLLHTIDDYLFKFEYESGEVAGITSIRNTLGESIPPKMIEVIVGFLLDINNGISKFNEYHDQKNLIFH